MFFCLVFIILVVFTRFTSSVIYFNPLLWHLLFKLSYSVHFFECHFFSLLWVVGGLWWHPGLYLSPKRMALVRAGFRVSWASPAWFEVLLLFSIMVAFWTWKGTKIGAFWLWMMFLVWLLILAFIIESWRETGRECLLRLLKGLARVKAENKYLKLSLPHRYQVAQVMLPIPCRCCVWMPTAESGSFTGCTGECGLYRFQLKGWTSGWKQLKIPKDWVSWADSAALPGSWKSYSIGDFSMESNKRNPHSCLL